MACQRQAHACRALCALRLVPPLALSYNCGTMRLGFVVKPLARPDLKSHDSRRWQQRPHLSVSLMHLRDIVRYLADSGITMYRISSDLAPYATHPDLPEFSAQIDECLPELAQVGKLAGPAGLRLSFHAAPHVVLNSPAPDQVARSRADLIHLSTILDLMGLGEEAVVVTHLGGIYGDRDASRQRFVREFLMLPNTTRRRVVLENDDTRFGVPDTVWVHQQTGIRLVFDNLHHRLNNPCRWPTREALAACLATWPAGEQPKIHFSTPRTDWLVTQASGAQQPEVRRTRWSYHADFVNPFEFVDFVALAAGLREFDVMLEARAKDLALLQLQHDLSRYAPDVSVRLVFDRKSLGTSTSPLHVEHSSDEGDAS
jgi:UV DNA damage endonuclease